MNGAHSTGTIVSQMRQAAPESEEQSIYEAINSIANQLGLTLSVKSSCG
jgi:hypothetical protein